MSTKTVLALGATGAIGQYLVPFLADLGYQVDVVSLEEKSSDRPNVRFLKARIDSNRDLEPLLARHYDGIIDCLYYSTADAVKRLPWIVQYTDHYLFLSSYRVYDGKEIPIRETTSRLLDTGDDILLRNSDDYSIYKCRDENILHALPQRNWTIVRPAITYAYLRYQLVSLEAANTVGRAFAGKKTVLPIQAKDVQATMSWTGDVGKMLARLLFNPQALTETYHVTTAEHHSWGEIADYYRDICGLEAVWVDRKDYLKIMGDDWERPGVHWMLDYDRLFNRIMDNSKVLKATGMTQAELMPLHQGLEREIASCPRDYPFPVNQAMDDYLLTHRL